MTVSGMHSRTGLSPAGLPRCICSTPRRSSRQRRWQAALFPGGTSSGGVSGDFSGISVAVAEPPPVQPPPEPLAIMHSGAFMRQRGYAVAPVSISSDEEDQLVPAPREAQRPPTVDNAIVWALEKVDRQLDQIEENPPLLLKATYDVANGPVGTATGKGVQAAARLTMAATTQAVKAAAPIGSWALKEGFKVASRAAVGLVAMALEQQQQQEQRREEGGGKTGTKKIAKKKGASSR